MTAGIALRGKFRCSFLGTGAPGRKNFEATFKTIIATKIIVPIVIFLGGWAGLAGPGANFSGGGRPVWSAISVGDGRVDGVGNGRKKGSLASVKSAAAGLP